MRIAIPAVPVVACLLLLLPGVPGGASSPEFGTAIPLGAPSPAWYTPELHAKVLAASARGMLYDWEQDREVAAGMDMLFIRPGAWMIAPSWCTMNFVHGSPGAYAIGSAGHCAASGDDVVIVAAPSLLAAIGRTTTSVDGGVGNDYSITPIAARWQGAVDPNVAVILGPEGGAYVDDIGYPRPVPVKHFGHGLAVGTGGTPRVGVVMYESPDGRAFYCHCVATPGDSGSPVLAVTPTHPMGQAMGVLTHIVVVGPGVSVVAGTRSAVISAAIVDGDLVPTP